MSKIVIKILISLLLSVVLACCTYLKYSSVQASYERIQNADPSQKNVKHLLNRESFLVIGSTLDTSEHYTNVSIAVVAYSDKYKANEKVDAMFYKSASKKHFGLNLPEGEYEILVYADNNNNNLFEPSEVVAAKNLLLNQSLYPELIASQVDISLALPIFSKRSETISFLGSFETTPSLYFPSGAIRGLDDLLFAQNMATLGMYDPASFLEHAPTMFYALEEDQLHKIPVVFVHGIGGSVRSFDSILSQLDRNRYKPWFFYYPSGGDLDQLADFFYNTFLSGEVIPLGNMPMIIVAHSMGGIITREAINKYKGLESENKTALFVSIASPFAGHPNAAKGEQQGLIVLPAWRDLNPNNRFIQQLFRKPLPDFLEHQLFYAFKNTSSLKLGENSDGVVPLFSQLHPQAQQQAKRSIGFNSGHVNVLSDPKMLAQLFKEMDQVQNIFSKPSLDVLAAGGFDVKLSGDYRATTHHLISYAGKYMAMLVHGLIEPMQQQRHFVLAAQGKVPANTELEKEFLMFMKEYPELMASVL